MVPNLDLILLAFIYGCFIACVVGAIIFAILNALLLAFSLTLFSIAIIDLRDLFSFVSRFAVPLKENLELGFALLVCTAMYYAIGAMMASKPLFERMVSGFKVKARHVLSHLEVLATSCWYLKNIMKLFRSSERSCSDMVGNWPAPCGEWVAIYQFCMYLDSSMAVGIFYLENNEIRIISDFLVQHNNDEIQTHMPCL